MHGNYGGLVLAGAMVLGVHEQEICAKSEQKRGVRYLYGPNTGQLATIPMSVCGGRKQLLVHLEADKPTLERYLEALFCLMADPLSWRHSSYASVKQSSMPSAGLESGLHLRSGVKAKCR